MSAEAGADPLDESPAPDDEEEVTAERRAKRRMRFTFADADDGRAEAA